MPSVSLKWSSVGLEQLKLSLLQLPQAVRNRIARKALEFAATPIVNMAKKLASPKGTRTNKVLNDLFKKTGVKQFGKHGTIKAAIVRKTEMVGADPFVKVGVLRKAFWANFVHAGSKRHDIPITSGPFKGRIINHPGHKANPFLTRAMEATRGEVLQRVRAKIEEGLMKYAAKEAVKGKRK